MYQGGFSRKTEPIEREREREKEKIQTYLYLYVYIYEAGRDIQIQIYRKIQIDRYRYLSIQISGRERESLLKAVDSCNYGGCQVQVPQVSILNINKRRHLPSLGPNMPPKVTSEVCDRAKSIPIQSRKSLHAHLSPCSTFCFLEQLLDLLPLIFFGKYR